MQQKKKKKSIIKALWLVYILNSIVATTLPVDFLIKSGFSDESKIMYLNDNWDVTIDGKEYQDVCLEEFSFDTLTIDDTLEMSNVLPKDWEYQKPVMCFHTRQAVVDMYIEDELVYQYGKDRKDNGKTVGSGLLFINMFDEYKGKEITIKLTVSERKAFSSLDEIWMSESDDSYRYVITKNRLAMFIGFFLLISGVIIACAGMSTIMYSVKNLDIFYLSIFSFTVGLWTLCYSNTVVMFSLPLSAISLMELTSVLVSPLPIIGYMKKYVYSLENKIYNKIYNIFFIGQIIFTVFLIVFHTFDIVHAAATLPYYHVALIIQIIFFSRVMYLAMKKGKDNKKIHLFILFGIITVVGFISYDLIRYIFNRYMGIKLINIPAASAIGVIILVIMLIVDFWLSVNMKILADQEKEVLIKSAYTDDLTQINNRLFCSEYMDKIAEETTEYSIICFDVNGLKQTNDKYGHSKGDLLIKRAANVISDVFAEYGIVGRMGGDEFIAILKTINREEIEGLLDIFSRLVDEVNFKAADEVDLAIAYGYALSVESENVSDAEKVYHMADKNMYVKKKEMKNIE